MLLVALFAAAAAAEPVEDAEALLRFDDDEGRELLLLPPVVVAFIFLRECLMNSASKSGEIGDELEVMLKYGAALRNCNATSGGHAAVSVVFIVRMRFIKTRL